MDLGVFDLVSQRVVLVSGLFKILFFQLSSTMTEIVKLLQCDGIEVLRSLGERRFEYHFSGPKNS